MNKYTVIGSQAVGGVEPGGTVELDPARINIPALILSGHVTYVTPSEDAPTEDKAKPRNCRCIRVRGVSRHQDECEAVTNGE